MEAVTRWLADGLLTASVQGAVVVAFIWAVSRAIPKVPAAVQAALWWLAALKLLVALLPVPPLSIPILPLEIESAVPARASQTGSPSKVPAAPDFRSIARPRLPGQQRSANVWPLERSVVVLLAIWFAGVSLHGVRLVGAFRAVRGLVRRSTPCSAEDAAVVMDLGPRLGLTEAPPVRISSEIGTPLLVGMMRPIVLLPADVTALTADERSMALAHELMHVRRHDLALGWVPALAGHLFFFHPLARLAAREYVTARESACDAAVIRALGVAPQDYGRLLVRAGVAGSASALAAGGASITASTLRRRLEMLQRVDTKVTRGSMFGIAAAMILAATPFRLVAITSPSQPVRVPSSTSALATPVFLNQDPDHRRGALANSAAAQGTDAAARERTRLEQQRRQLEEARRALEARAAETREALRQRLADLERARAQLEEAQRSAAGQAEAIAREMTALRQRENAVRLREAAEQVAGAQREALARLTAAQQAIVSDLRQRAGSDDYARGDLIVLSPDGNGVRPPDSRVLAVAGDRIRVATTGILVNGEPVGGLSPEFLAGLPQDPWEAAVSAGHYFVAADQRSASGASRFWGLIPADRVIGRR